ncbi:hypothetical protein D9754_16470 [Planomicrobium sp. Y74]|nr:hypothetical protein D9754_16470 [Planomicrobium sp. Y74]
MVKKPKAELSGELRENELERALTELREAGFIVKEGRKVPKDGVYSGIIGGLGNPLIINTGPPSQPVTKKKPLSYRNKSTEWTKNRAQVIQQLRDAGFEVKMGRRGPKDGVYSGIVGELNGHLIIDTKK